MMQSNWNAYITDENEKIIQIVHKTIWQFLIKLYIHSPYDPVIHAFTSRDVKMYVHTRTLR